MIPQLLRVSRGLVAAFVVAAFLKFVLFDASWFTAPDNVSNLSALWRTFGHVLAYVMPLAVLAAIMTEYIRVRHVALYIALGIVLALIAARLCVLGESLESSAFTGGALSAVSILTAGVLTSLSYWVVAGRYAGWRGDARERAGTMAAEAFREASANAQVDYCRQCLVGWSVLGVLLFALASWVLIDTTGLRDGFIVETETHGKTVLRDSGYTWAKFKVDGNRGVIAGSAPDEVQKRAAFDTLRAALGAVIGVPGILTHIENEAVARTPNEAVSQQLSEAARREKEAQIAIDAARKAADAARASEQETRRSADEKVLAAEAGVTRKLEEQALASQAEVKRKLEEQALAAEAEAKRKADEQAQLMAAEAARKQPAPPVEAAPVEVAAVEPAAPQDSTSVGNAGPPTGNDGGSPAIDPALPAGASCTSQDIALIDSSSILFDLQQFEITPNYSNELGRLAASAKACAPRPILVSGLADSNGDSLFNSALGLQRAEAVRAKLMERGVAGTLIIAKSATQSVPLYHDAGNVQHALNRRAEFKSLEVSEISRDATLDPQERVSTCESDLTHIMARSTIYFPLASAAIGDESTGLIKELASAIERCGSVIVTVEGHTDRLGDPNFNQSLSEARASTVREALVAAGANPTRVATRGFASSRPHQTGNTAAAFALNRRIEFKVSGKFTSTNAGGP